MCTKCRNTGLVTIPDVENGPEYDSEQECDCPAGEALWRQAHEEDDAFWEMVQEAKDDAEALDALFCR
jgi:hypothetical protein